ncbi:MAG: hypothetical protein H6R17_2009 [Proteobacteria bacterium]|nr:hypothetical protein [Pseudomonadota bacterium]
MANADYPLQLLCHPATPAPMVRLIEARATVEPDGSLSLNYRLWGDIARLRLPQSPSPERSDSLWQHTCFEAFVGSVGDTAYREFNLSPSGQWAAYAFTGYRQRDETFVPSTSPQIVTRFFAGHLEMDVTLPRQTLPSAPRLQLALAAVVEADDIADGRHSYWALRHPAARPDFHQRDAFTLELAAS